MKISVLCAAGASSTFAALHLRREAAARGLPVEISVSTFPAVLDEPDGSDVILLGSHMASERERLLRARPEATIVQLGSPILDRAHAGVVLDDIAAHERTASGAIAPQSEGQSQ